MDGQPSSAVPTTHGIPDSRPIAKSTAAHRLVAATLENVLAKTHLSSAEPVAAENAEAERLMHTLMSQMAPSAAPPSRPAVVPTIGASTARSDSADRRLVSAERDAAKLSASRRLVHDSLDSALAKVQMTPRETSPLTSSRLLSPTSSSRLPSGNLSSRKLAPAAADPKAGSGWLLAPDADAYCSGPRAASSEPAFDPAQPPAPAAASAAGAVAEGKAAMSSLSY